MIKEDLIRIIGEKKLLSDNFDIYNYIAQLQGKFSVFEIERF